MLATSWSELHRKSLLSCLILAHLSFIHLQAGAREAVLIDFHNLMLRHQDLSLILPIKGRIKVTDRDLSPETWLKISSVLVIIPTTVHHFNSWLLIRVESYKTISSVE